MNRTRRAIAHCFVPQKAQVLIMFAFVLVALLGISALVVDLGITYSQRRAMQNAADGSALAAAHQLAQNIASTSPGSTSCSAGCAFSVADQDIRLTVKEFVDDNKGWDPPAASYQLPASNPCGSGAGGFCIEYLDSNGNVLAKSPTSGGGVPVQTAMVRVTTGVSFSTLFAPVLGVDKMTATAKATAQISPAQKPKFPPGAVWPMTRVDQNIALTPPSAGQKCPDPVVFWAGSSSYQTGTSGSWKQLIYLGRKSAHVNTNNGISSNHDQLLSGFDTTRDPFATTPPADLTGSDVQNAMVDWFKYGWNGKLATGSYYPAPANANSEPTTWPIAGGNYGDKAEVVSGDLGNNMSSAMKYLIEHNPSGKDLCGDPNHQVEMTYSIVYMYLWDPASKEKWVDNTTPHHFELSSGNQVDRVSFGRWVPFKFYDSSVSFPSGGGGCGGVASGNSVVCGYFAGNDVDAPPTGGPSAPPSPDANVVHLRE